MPRLLVFILMLLLANQGRVASAVSLSSYAQYNFARLHASLQISKDLWRTVASDI